MSGDVRRVQQLISVRFSIAGGVKKKIQIQIPFSYNKNMAVQFLAGGEKEKVLNFFSSKTNKEKLFQFSLLSDAPNE